MRWRCSCGTRSTTRLARRQLARLTRRPAPRAGGSVPRCASRAVDDSTSSLIVGGGLVAGGLAAFGAVVYNEERIERMWVGASFDADGTAAVHEVIDYQFGNATDRHGLRRKIPGLTHQLAVRGQLARRPRRASTR